MNRQKLLFILLIFILLVGWTGQQSALAQEPVIQAVLFYSPSCPHCQEVINNSLPPLVQQYGTQLEIFGVDTYTEDGSVLFDQAMEAYGVPPSNRGVPTLIVGDQILMGSLEIPEKLPGIIESGLQEGGISYPDLPGLEQARIKAESAAGASHSSPSSERSLVERFRADLAGNTLSVVVLLGMLTTLIWMGLTWNKTGVESISQKTIWLIPLLAVIGLGIAIYMAFVEFTQTAAVCGPVGDCNTVQQSEYAVLFGVLPIGFLGVLGYLVVLLTWFLSYQGPVNWQKNFSFLLWGATLIGTLFSVYLTFLEPFVIGASCMWCLSSAVIMTGLLILATHLVRDRGVLKPSQGSGE